MSAERTRTWKIEGMTCGGCSSSVERALSGAPGVQTAKASHEAGTLTMQVADDADVPALLARVERAGFDVVGELSG